MKAEYIMPIIELLWFDEDEITTASGNVNYAAEQLDEAMRKDRTDNLKDFNITVNSVNVLTI